MELNDWNLPESLVSMSLEDQLIQEAEHDDEGYWSEIAYIVFGTEAAEVEVKVEMEDTASIDHLFS